MQRRPALVASLATGFIFAIILLVAVYLGLSNQKTSEIKARTVAQQVSNALEIMAADRVRALDDLVGHWPVAAANEIDWFNVRAVTLAKMLPGLRDLVLLDQQGRVIWSIDPLRRKQLLQLHLPTLLGAPLLDKNSVLHPPQQPQSLVVSRAISMQGKPHGYVAAFFDITTIIGVYTSELEAGGLSFRMQDGTRVLLQSGSFSASAPQATQPMIFAGRQWHFTVQSQTDIWQSSWWMAGLGFVISCGIGLLLYRQFAKEAQVRRFQQLYQSAADASLDAMLLWSRQGNAAAGDFLLQQSNKVAAQLCDAALLLPGQSLALLCQQLDAEWLLRRCLKVDLTGQPYEAVLAQPSALIHARWLRLQVVKSAQGLAMTFRDVSREQALQQQIRYQAEHDQLTGLLNRYAFEQRLAGLLQQPQAGALCYIDMDQFKQINDSCGHLAGDELLRRVASLLSTDLTDADVLARVGGDEFCLVLAGRDLAAVSLHLQQLLRQIAAFRFEWQQQIFTIGASVGVVALDGYQGSLTDLIKAADSGCYLAKHQGRHRYFIVDTDGPELNHLAQQRQLLSLLHKALDEDLFELYAQPIVPLSVPAQGLHLEVLLRLRDAEGQMVSPALFIPLAEQQGLMGTIDRRVIRLVLQQLAQSPLQLDRLDKIAINLSGPSLSDPELLPYIQQQLELYRIPAGKICFEITETAAITNMAAAKRFIDSLRQIGCRFALDDFGVGMSSFAYLKHLPVDYLKIDGSFVKAMTQNATDAVMVRAMADIARSLQIQTIAEFVPDEATCVLLRSIGVHYGQGYGLGKPAPWASFFHHNAA
jgi:diguanylate cyclase (GGDEF)-like protein